MGEAFIDDQRVAGSCPPDHVGGGRTIADLERWAAAMPEEARTVLARGPRARAYTCGVCRALEIDEAADWNEEMYEWHGARAVSGELSGVERYLRCLLVYLVAGWDGIHREVGEEEA